MTNHEWLRQAQRLIPYTTQTISKLPHPGTEPLFPYFIKEAKGARMTDVEGRSFIDFFCSCGPIILGHAHQAVDDRVKRQIDKGFLFSTSSYLEVELAQKLIELFPYYGWVKFLKTGADAVTAAVRIARAYTKKENILQDGYHGWHDWYQAASGMGRMNGIPDFNKRHIKTFPYNDVSALEKMMKDDTNLAAVVMTPYDWMNDPEPQYLSKVRELCTRYGVLLIFDEIKTGFRIGLTGVQGKYQVEPDITTFAKSISNGYPLSVVTGKAELLSVMNDFTTLISTTYAGDAISLAAGLATIQELQDKAVFAHLDRLGGLLIAGMQHLAQEFDLQLKVRGATGLWTFEFSADQALDQQFFVDWVNHQLRNGIFMKLQQGYPSYNLMYAHTDSDIEHVLETTRQFFKEKCSGWRAMI
jgi:glutamate-1-semialdehyde aminotransferase